MSENPDATSGLLTEIDHVAIAVRDLDSAVDYYQRAFGATVAHREVVSLSLTTQVVLRTRPRLTRASHQKYPSCFFFSIDASPPSLSITRPCRSLVVVSSIS